MAGFAQRLWTSVATLRGAGRPARELCGLVNEALRRDDAALLEPLMVRGMHAHSLNGSLALLIT